MKGTNWVLVGAALLALGACDKLKLPGGNESGDAGTSATPGSEASKKLDAYIGAHNTLLGLWGLQDKAEAYRKSEIGHSTLQGEYEFNVGPGNIGDGIKELKAARAMGGGPSDIDAAADAVIQTASKVQAHLASLEPYYDRKQYLDDKLARGKAEDPQMLAELDAAEKAFSAFSKLLDGAIDQRDAALLDTLKTRDPIGYQTKLGLIHGKKLLGLFDAPDAVKQPETFTKADAEVAIIEKTIDDAHQAASKQGKPDPSASKELTNMVSYYRTFRESKEDSTFQWVIGAYNNAVEAANSDRG